MLGVWEHEAREERSRGRRRRGRGSRGQIQRRGNTWGRDKPREWVNNILGILGQLGCQCNPLPSPRTSSIFAQEWNQRQLLRNWGDGESDCRSGGQPLMSHISDWLCRALWVAGWRLPAAKMTSKSGCVCQPASLKATTTPHLGTASQVRSRDSRRGRAWSGWGSCPRVTTGPYYPPHRFFPGKPYLVPNGAQLIRLSRS